MDSRWGAFGFSFVKSNLSIVAISKRKPLRSSLRVCLKKKKKRKEKVSNDLIVRAKTDDLKKKKKYLETIVRATIKITPTFAS